MAIILIRIFAVGKMKDKRLSALTVDFLTRCRPMARVEVTEIKDSTNEREDQDLAANLAAAGSTALVVAMDEKGEDLSSEEFARLLESQGNISFVIGGADGLGPRVRAAAQRTVRLSSMTWTHEMARLLLCEQIYRGFSILRGKPYHRA
jgi:23S rRNA (pseudouridine1915-N3)-methyltransferase